MNLINFLMVKFFASKLMSILEIIELYLHNIIDIVIIMMFTMIFIFIFLEVLLISPYYTNKKKKIILIKATNLIEDLILRVMLLTV